MSSALTQAWYSAEEKNSQADPAQEAFKAALHRFSTDVIQQVSGIEELRATITDLDKNYTNSRSSGRKWVTRLNRCLSYYSNVFNVLALHHPEYVALAWNAMKCILKSVTNHEKLLHTISKALAEIAGQLPRVELVSSLYCSERIIAAFSELYSIIIRFLIRAQGWVQESDISRALQSIMRPAELRYSDLIVEIDTCSGDIQSFIASASQAEIHDMRLQMETYSRGVKSMAASASQAEIHDMQLQMLEMRSAMRSQQEESKALTQELKRLGHLKSRRYEGYLQTPLPTQQL